MKVSMSFLAMVEVHVVKEDVGAGDWGCMNCAQTQGVCFEVFAGYGVDGGLGLNWCVAKLCACSCVLWWR